MQTSTRHLAALRVVGDKRVLFSLAAMEWKDQYGLAVKEGLEAFRGVVDAAVKNGDMISYQPLENPINGEQVSLTLQGKERLGAAPTTSASRSS